jgi:hypothetical protein
MAAGLTEAGYSYSYYNYCNLRTALAAVIPCSADEGIDDPSRQVER